MTRKILAGGLICLSCIMLILSVVGIGAMWICNRPLTHASTTFVQDIDSQLAQVLIDIQNAKAEVERALRIIESAEKALAPLSAQTSGANDLLAQANSLLNDKLIPGLQTTNNDISQVRDTVENLRTSLTQVNTLPFLNLNLPGDEFLASILSKMDALNSEISSVQDLAQRVSTFMSDTSYLMGGDFTETKQHLEDLLLVLKDYDSQITDWRTQAGKLIESLPGWIILASVVLTICLLWFGFSQYGLLLHGFNLWKGGNPFKVVIRKNRISVGNRKPVG
jgi:uncharacterized protein YoxC